uniref:Ig-like domain-containing protein n=1 Tax=Maylandia zebra TaxID=106582 RepID=A0A3P9ARA9_9CICH
RYNSSKSCSVSAHYRDMTFQLYSESGHSVTLPCRAPNDDITITAVEWTRTDLKNEYVFFYRNKGFDPANQHPSFKNRVDLQDRQMKDGDVSLILKDVTTADSGTYECRVAQRKTNEEIATLNLISSINLSVVVPPDLWVVYLGSHVFVYYAVNLLYFIAVIFFVVFVAFPFFMTFINFVWVLL